MARNGFRIVDSDLHVNEPPNLYTDYLDRKFLDRAPRWIGDPDVLGWDVQDGKAMDARWRRREVGSRDLLSKRKRDHYADELEHGYTPEIALRAMDREGIDVAIVFRTHAHMAIHVEGQDPRYSLAVCQAFNNWLKDFTAADPKRLRGAAILALNDTAAAAKEAERAVKDLGFLAVTLVPSVLDDRMLHDPECDRLWATLQDLDIPVTFHDTSGGFSSKNPGYWFREHPNNLVLTHAFSFPLTLMMAIGCFTVGGVLERFPRLRAAFLEGNCSWLPWLLYRLDEQWEIFGEGQDTELKQRPSEYFKERCFVSVEADGEFLGQVVEAIGDDNIVLSTDYPHPDSNYPFAVEKFLGLSKVSDSTKRKILWDNCARLYNL
jgi:predicted TIM-barrel fold metal-dependent hydrolase